MTDKERQLLLLDLPLMLRFANQGSGLWDLRGLRQAALAIASAGIAVASMTQLAQLLYRRRRLPEAERQLAFIHARRARAAMRSKLVSLACLARHAEKRRQRA